MKLIDEMIAAAKATQNLRIDMESGDAANVLNLEAAMHAALKVVERKLLSDDIIYSVGIEAHREFYQAWQAAKAGNA